MSSAIICTVHCTVQYKYVITYTLYNVCTIQAIRLVSPLNLRIMQDGQKISFYWLIIHAHTVTENQKSDLLDMTEDTVSCWMILLTLHD